MATSPLTVKIDATDMKDMFKPVFRELQMELLCGLLGVDDEAIARDWLVAKIAQYRSVSEADVDQWLRSVGI